MSFESTSNADIAAQEREKSRSFFFRINQESHKFFEHTIHKNWVCIGIVILFSLVTFLAPIAFWGIPSGLDLETDLRFASAYMDAIRHGTLLTAWANDGGGFGSIGVRFYPPLPFITLALTQLATQNWFTSLCLNLTLWMVVGGIGMFYLCRQWGSPMQSTAAAVIYAVVPGRLNEIFQYVLYAEFAAWAILPFCFLFLSRVCERRRWSDAFALATTSALLVLTHIPTTIIAALVFPIFTLFLIERSSLKKTLVQLGFAFVVTLLATAFRLVILVNELSWLAHNDSRYISGFYETSSWLFPAVLVPHKLLLLVIGSWISDITVALTVILLVPSLIVAWNGRLVTSDRLRIVIRAMLFTALFVFFMVSRLSEPIWRYFSLLQKIQFPWRMLSVLSIMAVVGLSLSIPILTQTYPRLRRTILYSIVFFVVLMSLFDYTQLMYPSAPYTHKQFDKLVSELTTKPIWEGWWPIWAKSEAFRNESKVSVSNRDVKIFEWDSADRVFKVRGGEPQEIRVATFFYPYWKATVNGAPAQVSKDENGTIIIPISSQESEVHLFFEEPVIERLAIWVSLLTWIAVAFGLVALFRNRFRLGRLLDKPVGL